MKSSPKDSPHVLKVNQTMGTANCDIKAFLLFWPITDGNHTKQDKTVGCLSRSLVVRKKKTVITIDSWL